MKGKAASVSGAMLALLLASISLLTFSIQPVNAEPHIITVPDDYGKIQWAIGNATTGATIFVRAGTYYEHISINIPLSVVGENRDTTIIDGNGTGCVIEIVGTRNVVITGFTIRNSGPGLESGIFLWCTDDVIVKNNIINGNNIGIWVDKSRTSNINGNVIDNNIQAAIAMEGSFHSTVDGNHIMNNEYGIFFLQYCSWNIIFHNNFVDNSFQVASGFRSTGNIWDDGYPSCGNYWSDYIGNDAYCGPYQNETGCDGIGDTSYVIDENNNDRYPLMQPWVPPIGTHDIAVTNVTVSTNETYHGLAVEINVTVQNKGDQTETRFTVTAVYDLTPIETRTVTNLAPNHQAALTITWNTKGAKPGNYTVSAQASPLPGEADTADNSFTDGVVEIKPTPGDVNADGEVDMKDIYQLVLHYGCERGEACYVANCDINADGIINMKDIYLAIMNFGKTV